ncbi:hypothetical protein [Cellvibrio sp. UBA7671]|uniref:hypothetical protein n=1 Tax=Cellvibrio sp. UBA7671 TaxID=1946312 RepID=UPI002ABBEA60|nr:TetR family transcriptional regulator [Pseudomonadota bacterium]
MTVPASEVTRKIIRQAYIRILNGRPKIVDKGRRISIASVAEESGLSRATIHKYYPDMVDKIRTASGKAYLDVNDQKISQLKVEQIKNKELRAELGALKKNLEVLGSKYAALLLKYEEVQAIINGNNVSIFNVNVRN